MGYYLIIVFSINIEYAFKKISSHCVFSQNNCGLSIPKNVDRFAVPYIWLQRQRFFCSSLMHKVSFQEYLIPHGLLTSVNSFYANIVTLYAEQGVASVHHIVMHASGVSEVKSIFYQLQ